MQASYTVPRREGGVYGSWTVVSFPPLITSYHYISWSNGTDSEVHSGAGMPPP